MAKGKLILICQSGGKFETNSDGSLSYTGGEAEALDINRETSFDDLRLKIAKLLNFDCESLSLKYFLPGNRKTPITLKNDKDLTRMYDFHKSSVTADVFVMGQAGFSHDAIHTPIIWTSKMAANKASTTDVGSGNFFTVPVQTSTVPANVDSTYRETSPTDTLVDVPVLLSIDAGGVISTPPCRKSVHDPVMIDMSASPADTVKKRRRSAQSKKGPSGHTVFADNEIINGSKKGKSNKEHGRNIICTANTDDIEEQLGTALEINDFDPYNASGKELVASWENLVTGIGQEFDSVTEFRDALQKYAIANRFGYKLKKNEASRVSGTCVVEGCSWRIHASWVPSSGVFKIKNMNRTHTCQGESWKVAHPPKNWLVSVIKEKLQENPHPKTKDIANGLFQDFGLRLSYCQVWRAIEEARGQLQGSYKDAYSWLPCFCNNMIKANPGSMAKLVIGADRRFQRLFVSFRPCIHGFENGCRPILFLDAVSLRSKYHEILLTASALDGDDGVFPVAFAVVDIETDDSWCWFLGQLRSVVSNPRPITFVSDKEKGLTKPIMEIFENAYHGYSIYYLMEDFLRNMRGPFNGDGKVSLPLNFLGAARANELDGFSIFTEHIKQASLKTYEWVMKIEAEHWTNALFKGERYSHINFDTGELYSSWIQENSELPIAKKIESIVCKTSELINNRQESAKKWHGRLTPSKEEKLQEECLKARSFKVFMSSDTMFEVHDNSVHVVDITKRECSCLGWDPVGLPCGHAIAVLNSRGWNVYDYCSKDFTIETFRITYSESIDPTLSISESHDEENDAKDVELVLPPPFRAPVHENKMPVKRRGLKRSVCCTRCQGLGHNKATCKEPL